MKIKFAIFWALLLFTKSIVSAATYKVIVVQQDFSLESIVKNCNKQTMLGVIISTNGNYNQILDYLVHNDKGIDFKESDVNPNLIIVHISDVSYKDRSYVRLVGCNEPYDLNQMSYYFLYNNFEHHTPELQLDDDEINGLEISPVCDWESFTLYKLNKFKACPDNKVKFYTDILLKNTKGYFPFSPSSEFKDFSPKSLKKELRDSSRNFRTLLSSIVYSSEEKGNLFRFGIENAAIKKVSDVGTLFRMNRGFTIEFNRSLKTNLDNKGVNLFLGVSSKYLQTRIDFSSDSLNVSSVEFVYQGITQTRNLVIKNLYDNINYNVLLLGLNFGVCKNWNLNDVSSLNIEFSLRPSYVFNLGSSENVSCITTNTAKYSNISHLIKDVSQSDLYTNRIISSSFKPVSEVKKITLPFGLKVNYSYKNIGCYIGCDVNSVKIQSGNLYQTYSSYANYFGGYNSILYSDSKVNQIMFVPSLGLNFKL